MKESQQDLHQLAVDDLEELAETLAAEGMPSKQIQRVIEDTIKLKMRQKFRDRNYEPSHVKHIMQNLMSDALGCEFRGPHAPDSESEGIMREILQRADIDFDFHKEIGRYTVDFFIPPDKIIECDGPHHNKPEQIKHDEKRDDWLRKKGYKIFRITTSAMFILPTSKLIENLNEFVEREEW